MIAIVDYGAGNLRSVAKAFAQLGHEPVITQAAQDIQRAQALILPGVGSAGHAMAALTHLGLVTPIRDFIANGKPFFGVCLGLQLLFSFTEEEEGCDCMGVLSGSVRRLPKGLKIPHMGWNQVRQGREHPIFQTIPDGNYFYFVHSYYAQPDDPSVVAGQTDYGVTFASVIIRDNVVATQFHPEKSGPMGLRIYENFLRWSGLL